MTITRNLTRPLFISLLALAAGCTALGSGDDDANLENVGTVAPMSFEEYLELAVSHYEPDTDSYIVEGDIRLHGIDEVRAYYQRSIAQPGALTALDSGGNKWADSAKKSLSYCINAREFGDAFEEAEEAMAAAAKAWQDAADVGFIYKPDQNANCHNTNSNVTFDVQPHDSNKTCSQDSCSWTNASSFFPWSSRAASVLYIYPEAYEGNKLQGILLHELGHVLGFLHEHVWIGCTTEGTGGKLPLTEYDETSVMHYRWCGGSNGKYRLSLLDAQGAQQLYGTPSFDVVRTHNYDMLKGDITRLTVGDFNGDGVDDFIRQETNGGYDDINDTANVWLSHGNGDFDQVTPGQHAQLNGDFTTLTVGDFNGDGLDDFIRQEKGSWDNDNINTANVWFSVGDGTFNVVAPGQHNQLKGDYTKLTVGDFNGDGMDDFIRQEKGAWDDDDTNTANVWLSNGNGTFTQVTPGQHNQLKGDYTKLTVGDFNGDGKDDFIRQEMNGWDDDNTNAANVWLSNGNGTFTIINPNSWPYLKGSVTDLHVGDFNGDGKDDFIRQEKGAWDDDDITTAEVWLSNGNGTFTITWSADNKRLKGDMTNLYVGDFNNDGKDDFIRQEKGAWATDEYLMASAWLSAGDGTFSQISLPAEWTFPGEGARLMVGDFDGDGRADFVRQEQGSWDNDDHHTAQVFFSRL